MPGNYTLRKTYVDGDILSASDYVADHQQHIDNQTPQGTDDYSANVTQMRTVTDHGDVNSESLATTLAGEIERLRYAINHVKTTLNGSTVTQWYSKSYSVVVPNSTITSAKLANGATFIQYVRATSENVTVGVADTTLVSQAITLTRSRVKLHGVMHSLALNISGLGGDISYTLKLKRNGSEIANVKFYTASGGASGESDGTGVIEFIDNPGAGTYTYTLTAVKSGAGYTAIVNFNVLALEEVA